MQRNPWLEGHLRTQEKTHNLLWNEIAVGNKVYAQLKLDGKKIHPVNLIVTILGVEGDDVQVKHEHQQWVEDEDRPGVYKPEFISRIFWIKRIDIEACSGKCRKCLSYPDTVEGLCLCVGWSEED